MILHGCQGLLQLWCPQELQTPVGRIASRLSPKAAMHLSGLLTHESGQFNSRACPRSGPLPYGLEQIALFSLT